MGDRQTLLVVGAATRDLDPTDPRGWRLGGTVAYASLAAARLGVHVWALVGADAEAASASELDLLRDAGVGIRLVPLERGPVFDNQQSPAGRIQVAHHASDRIAATSLPPEWADTATVLLGPVADELDDDWASRFPRETFVALTWQGLLRRLVPGHPVASLPLARSPLVARCDALLLSAEDVAAGAPRIRELLRDGQTLLLTHGERGAVSLRTQGSRIVGRAVPAIAPSAMLDTTGAGDTFLAGWLAARLLAPGASDAAHLAVAAAMSSLKIARPGLNGMPATRELCVELLKLRETRRR